jgi:broad specificity phosphatase PhoE
VELLSDYRPHRIISSPLVRCVQTMTPLAQSLGLRIERTKRLTPDAGDAATNLLRRVGQGSDAVVLCTHGEVIHELQSKLEGHTHLFGRNPLRGKGSVWALEQVDGRFVTATYLPPPPHRR